MSISAIDTIDQHKPDAQATGPAASNLPTQSDAQSTSEQAAVPPKPRAPRMPSDRDFQVFRMAEIQGLTHEQIASTCGVSRRRISQIVERVRNWLSQHPCEDPQIATELQRKRLAQHMERMQLQDVIDRARFALTLAPTHLETVTIRADGKE